MKKFTAILLALVMVVALCASASADNATVLKLGTTVNEEDSFQVAAEKFAELVKERTNGAYEIEIYPNGTLGDESSMLESMQIGVLDAGIITSGPFVNFVPEMGVLDMPFLFANNDEAYTILDGEIGQELLGKLEDAGFAAWDLDIAANDKQLTAVVKNLEPDMEKAKIFAETRAGGAALLNTAVNLMIGEGLEGAMAAADEADSQAAAGQNAGGASSGGFTPYAAIGGNSMRYETGSYVDSDGWGINVGFSRKLRYEKHTLTLAPLVEYGKANYASHLDDGTRGDGSNQFLGIGCIVRDEQNDGMYYEGSRRVGRMKGDYRGEANSSYDTASNYLGFHAGIGKVFKYQDNKLDIYGKFFWSRQGGDDVVITSDSGAANYTFDAINSYRMRIGTRWTQQIATRQAVYMGAAWDYEFDSEARAHYMGMSTPSPTMKGASGMLELGLEQEATKDNPFGADVGVTGWCGKQRGISFNAGFSWAF